MHEEDYTFVTIDNDDALMSDAVIVDLDDNGGLDGAVVIDDASGTGDFITLSDDTLFLSDVDTIDLGDLNDADISVMI